MRGHGLRLALLDLLHSGERLAEAASVYARRASSSRTGRANPSSRDAPNSTKRTPPGGADSTTRWLTSTWPAAGFMLLGFFVG